MIVVKIGKILNEAGLKATPQRKMIYEIMTEFGHSSIDEIIVKVQEKSPEVTLSTIYRIIDTFYKSGLITKLNHPSGKCFYDITLHEHCHILMDNEITDYDDPELTNLVKSHLKKKSFKHLDAIEKISIHIIVKQNKQVSQ